MATKANAMDTTRELAELPVAVVETKVELALVLLAPFLQHTDPRVSKTEQWMH